MVCASARTSEARKHNCTRWLPPRTSGEVPPLPLPPPPSPILWSCQQQLTLRGNQNRSMATHTHTHTHTFYCISTRKFVESINDSRTHSRTRARAGGACTFSSHTRVLSRSTDFCAVNVSGIRHSVGGILLLYASPGCSTSFSGVARVYYKYPTPSLSHLCVYAWYRVVRRLKEKW